MGLGGSRHRPRDRRSGGSRRGVCGRPRQPLGRRQGARVFKTTDGGLTWTNVLFVNEDTGATELVMDPANNKVLCATPTSAAAPPGGSMAAARAAPSTSRPTPAGHLDEADRWHSVRVPLGRIGLDVYRANPNILYAYRARERRRLPIRQRRTVVAEDVERQPAADVKLSQIRIDPTNDLPRLRPRRPAPSRMTAARPSSRTARCIGSSRDVDQPGERTTSSTATTAASA